MKKLIIISIIIMVIIFLGLMLWGNGEEKAPNTNQMPAGETIAKEEGGQNQGQKQGQDQNAQPAKRPNKMCGSIESSDVVITLDLPEKYARYNDRTVFPSYEVGFMFKSAHGDIAESVKMARKQCAYKVGFSKEELNNIHGRFFPIIRKDANTFLTYQGDPMMISLQENGLPEQGKTVVLKVTGETTDGFNRYVKLLQ